ncbi:MAG: hypothetical protein KME45_03315 [Stenomitos rutilans HA7619-LM2]|jgi:hypothetical protein|nr:hypothetical protein [Stenomitos rutilans HA7619-LM2]MBW4469414.1 hypothetical protein [Stenomitos rutilans HA7619-LM2]
MTEHLKPDLATSQMRSQSNQEETIADLQNRVQGLEQQLDIRLKLLSASLALGGALAIGALAGFTWEYKSDNSSLKFGLSPDTIGQLLSIVVPAVGTGGAIAVTVQKKAKP